MKGLEQMRETNNTMQRSKQIKDYFFNKSSVDYLHNVFLYEARKKLLNELKTSDYSMDSLIFVETYSQETPSYTCSVYKSDNIEYLNIYIEKKIPFKIEYLKPDRSLTQYVIKEIRKGNLDSILEQGKQSNIYPISYLYITIAIKQGKDYKMKLYTTKCFLIKKEKSEQKADCSN
ncbi:hypothetical protein D0T84_20680 [Dysgonomonas sp. 521]|uniref:hypothetical protein n=1 Tax=Dysgonomonas sp. 521 TaxID=2302932 RepID=UPI0013CFBFFE|nr:hypothetical protein [Dysgonomonas sp. 521]NDV97297.1 hypothetical protein [Dysgonomonas sp. 521]